MAAKGDREKKLNGQEVVNEYVSSLSDLTLNSKPLINMLTILAEESIDHAEGIVKAVEAHLLKVRSDIKLPVLYLIDSIIKNVNRNYLPLFSQNIVNTFCHVFEKVDEATRSSMWKLRQTWNDVFSPKKLYALDIRVQSIDPAWPITSTPGNMPNAKSIHVNPKFLPQMQRAQPQQPKASAPIVQVNANLPTPDVANRELLKKRQELLELQKQKIELELQAMEAMQKNGENPELITAIDFDKQKTPIPDPSLAMKMLEKQFPAAISKLRSGHKTGNKLIPASSMSIATAAVTTSRDPRLKNTTTPTVTTAIPENLIAEGPKEQEYQQKPQQLLEQLKMQLQQTNKNSSLIQTTNESSLAKTTVTTASSPPTITAIPPKSHNTEIPEKNANIIDNNQMETNVVDSNKSSNSSKRKDSQTKKDHPANSQRTGNNQKSNSQSPNNNQSKSSSSSKSSSRTSSSKSSSSSSSRKVGSKSRSKSSSSSSSSSPIKIPKLEGSSPPRSTKNDTVSSPSSTHSTSSQKNRSTTSSKTKSKSRKRSPSPSVPYRIPRRNAASETKTKLQGLHEEEQSGSLIVSPPHPPAFKEIRSTTRQRNYVRRNKEGSSSPDPASLDGKELRESSKDEDLRPLVQVTPTVVPNGPLETKEDLDLRILPGAPGKRQSADTAEPSTVKKSKAEKFDELFGNEDVDLRMLTNPKAGRPPTPPPPVISHENEKKDGWAKIKAPNRGDRDTRSCESNKSIDRNRDRLGRPRLYNKSGDEMKERRRGPGRDLIDKHERNPDRNIEIIMKQAAEQLDQGAITRSQYNKLIQDVLHMSEDQKLRAAQKKEKEMGMLIWEKGDLSSRQNYNDENMRPKDHGMHPRGNGPRWNGPWHGPWPPPPPPPPHGPFPPFGPDFRPPMGPWANCPRPPPFGMRPDFHQFHNSGFNPRMPMLPNGPMMMNGPMLPMLPPMGPMGSRSHPMMMNGPMRSDGNNKQNSSNSTSNLNRSNSPSNNSNNASSNNTSSSSINGISSSNSTTNIVNTNTLSNNHDLANSIAPVSSISKSSTGEDLCNIYNTSGALPPPDTNLIEAISKDFMKSINIDSIPREIRYYGDVGIVFINWDEPRDIGFQDGQRRIFIDDKETLVCSFNDDYKEFIYESEKHKIKLGAPTRELYVDGKWYECYFGGGAVSIDLGNKKVNMKLEGPPPQVKIGNFKRTDLVLGKINLIINAKKMVPVFLDAKPQMFEIDDSMCTIEFADALQTVYLNGIPFEVEFGGLPKPVIINNKKHFIRFTVLPKGFKAGYVDIIGMKGEAPKECPVIEELNDDRENADRSQSTFSSETITEPDSTSQDASDMMSISKPDLQLDVLSSVIPSAMAPSSGLSYQAEPIENPPPISLPLDLNALFQRLVETGIVPNVTETKKSEEEEEKKKPAVITATFDKPETLKTKQPEVYTALYTGMQCSSCGARFPPELATRYSHHLDWHFRQNRRERDAAKKAHSRPWYYDVSDWTQFEEIEDLEDRAQSWFETEKQSAETENAASDDTPDEASKPSVPASNDDEDSRCNVCQDAFEQFYNEEKEEWHYRPAVSYENKNYHPLCLEDHKRALEKSAMVLEETLAVLDKKAENTDTEVEKTEDTPEQETMEIEADQEITCEEPVQDIETATDLNTENNDDKTEEPMEESFDEQIQIIETVEVKRIEIVEDLVDDSDEEDICVQKSEQEILTSDLEKTVEHKDKDDDIPMVFENIKIKEEPVDTYETEPEEVIAEPPPDLVDTTQVEVKTSIDGNVENDVATSTIPTATSKIKINITKVLPASKEPPIESKETEDKVEETVAIEVTPVLTPKSIKPSLSNRKLSNLPPVEKGEELSALCSIM